MTDPASFLRPRSRVERGVGALLFGAEHAIGYVWTLGELAVMGARIREILDDPHRELVLRDIETRGFCVPVKASDVSMKEKRMRRDRGGEAWLVGTNPYARIGSPSRDRIVARFVRADPSAYSGPGTQRRLLVMCHCYGVPSPTVMSRLFGLADLGAEGPIDVAYNLTNHHVRGDFSLWPGTGLLRGRLSHFLENLRSAVTGVRGLVAYLREREDYERVTVLGFSLGGFLALHLASSLGEHGRPLVDRCILYAPVTRIDGIARELGILRELSPLLYRGLAALKPGFSLEDLTVANPLRYPLRIDESDLTVIAQRNDAMTPIDDVAAVHARYPGSQWHEFEGTHLFPRGLARFREVIRSRV